MAESIIIAKYLSCSTCVKDHHLYNFKIKNIIECFYKAIEIIRLTQITIFISLSKEVPAVVKDYSTTKVNTISGISIVKFF